MESTAHGLARDAAGFFSVLTAAHADYTFEPHLFSHIFLAYACSLRTKGYSLPGKNLDKLFF